MKGRLILTIVVLTLSLASCNGLPTSPTFQPPHTPAVALTATSAPTPTAKPTTKATIPPTKAVETLTVTPDIAGTVVAISQPKVFASYPSPDGQWRAEVIIYECVQVSSGPEENAYEQLKLIRVDTGDEGVIDSQLQNCGGLGAYGLGGLFWSPNSRYFYYTYAREGVPDGCGYWERPITRLDVANQNSEYLGGGPLSPDEAKIATWQGQELVVWDVNQGELARAQAAIPDAMPGPIAWSPDSQAMVYLQTTSDCPLLGKSYVVRLDLPGLEHTLLLESETPSFGGIIWDTPNRISLFDEVSKRWEFNLATGTLTPDAAGLTIEEYPIISADVDAPYRFEFLDHIPDKVLARREEWRGFNPARHASAINEKLAPFGYRLVPEANAEWHDTFYDLYRGDELLLSDLRHVWPVTVNESRTDFALMAENGPNQFPLYLLVRNGDVQAMDWTRLVYNVPPVYLGDDLLTVEILNEPAREYAVTGGVIAIHPYAVKRNDETIYTYTPSQPVAGSHPVVRLLAWEGHWILETFDGVIVDGESLSEQLGVNETFHYIIFQGRPLFFFRENGRVHISYGGEMLPPTYDEVVHHQCCEPAAFNIGSNEHMLWFYALKDETWYYVEIGAYNE